MKRISRMARVAVTALGMGATAWAGQPPLVITLMDSSQVMTVGGSGGQDADAVVLSPFQLKPEQGFWLKPVGNPEDKLFNIISQQSSECLDVKDGSREDGALIVQRECGDAESQVFHVSDRGSNGHRDIRNALSGKCLAAPPGGDFSSSQLVQWKCTGGDNQRFRISAPPTTASQWR